MNSTSSATRAAPKSPGRKLNHQKLIVPDSWRFWIVALSITKMCGFNLFEVIEVQATAALLLVSAVCMALQHKFCGVKCIVKTGRVLLPLSIVWIWFVRLPLIQNTNLHIWLTALVTVIRDASRFDAGTRISELGHRLVVCAKRSRYGSY